MNTLKLLLYPLFGMMLISCFESDRIVVETTEPEILFLEGLFIQLDSPSTACDWILETNTETYGFREEIEEFFQIKSFLFDTQTVVVRYDSIIQSENCPNFDLWIENLEIFEQKPLIDDIQLLDQEVQFTARMDSIFVANDYLIVDYSASGCDRFTWEVALVDTGTIIGSSSPPQRNLIFWFSNRGGCAAESRQKAIFNIQELQLAGGQVQLNVSNNGNQNRSVLYSY